MRAQQLELIYSQYGLLYEILPDAPRSILDKTRQRVGPHVDGIVGSTQAKSIDPLSKQLQQLLIQQTAASQTTGRLLPLPKCRMYTVYYRQTRRPTNSPTGRRNNERRVRGIRNLPIMLAGETLKRKRRSIHVICAWKTTQLISSLGSRRPKIYCHNNSLLC
jgi:hypothetical protein